MPHVLFIALCIRFSSFILKHTPTTPQVVIFLQNMLKKYFFLSDICPAYFIMKYILVSGGVISGIGKGVVASSLGVILKQCNVRVTCVKIDPYLNIDAGTFSPYEHGEVYVLDDGGEVDLDLGKKY